MTWPTGDSLDPTADATWVTADNGTAVTPTPDPFEVITADRYMDLITSYHRGRPKFSAMMVSLLEPPAAQQTFTQHLPLDFDLDVAVGVQLDVVGEWVGRSRFIRVPIPNVYFTFDDDLRGFDAGVWKGPYDSDAGVTRLDDETYRTLLRAKIAANHWDGTLPDARRVLDIVFPNGDTKLFIVDNQDMTMTFGVSGTLPSLLFIVLLSQGYIPVKPEGVLANYVITSEPGPMFGFDVDNEFISGFDSGAWGVPPEYFTGP